MAFRSTSRPWLTRRCLLGVCTLLVPFALSCSSNGGAEKPGGAPLDQRNQPNQPGTLPENATPAGPSESQPAPGQPGTATNGVGEALPGNIAVAQPPPAPATGMEPVVSPPDTTLLAPPLVAPGASENSGAACNATAAELRAPDSNLPDPFAMHDGTRIATKAQWECRRSEIRKDIERFEIGTKPEPPTVNATLVGNMLSVAVSTAAGAITLRSNVGTVAGDAPHCVAIGMNVNSSLINGCVQVPFMHDQVVTYNQNGTINLNDPFYTLYPELRNRVANYAAWSWGISRIIDGLDQLKDQLNIDMTKIGVHGCSYAGKMALFGGAFDERVALTFAQESGGGGINSWRLSQAFTSRTGTQIEKIDNTNYSWFLSSMRGLNPNALPHDHHELIAMIAPRAVVAFGNRDFEWLGDESGYKSVKAAQEVWKALGADANFGYDFTTGHAHCSAAPSQVTTANAFVDRFLKGRDVDTNIAIPAPVTGGTGATFDLDQTKVIQWQTPALQ